MAAVNLKYSNLGTSGSGDFQSMIQHFGVVTVMNVDVFDTAAFLSSQTGRTFESIAVRDGDIGNARGILDALEGTGANPTKGAGYLGTIDSLKIANISSESSDKTITGGRYNNPLIKFYSGKTARLEMQDALGHASMLEAFNGAVCETDGTSGVDYSKVAGVHFGGDIPTSKTLVGDTFFIDQISGAQVAVKIIFYNFMPEPIFNLTQDAEGDATVFDMNGDLLITDIKIGTNGTQAVKHGVFYSIVDPTTGE